MGEFVTKLKNILTRRRMATAFVLSLILFLGYFAYPQIFSFFGYSDVGPASTEISPAATLQAMTDADLRAFALDDQLPDYLRTNDWVRTAMIQKSLRERVAGELVKRWDRDCNHSLHAASNPSASNVSVTPVGSQFDPTQRGVLGVQFVDRGAGLTISYVYPSSAAARAGLHVGDEILAINGGRVASQSDLHQLLSVAANAGGQAQVEIQRNYSRRYVTADVSGRDATSIATRGHRRY